MQDAMNNTARTTAPTHYSTNSLAAPLTVAEFWANRKGETLRVTLSEYEGRPICDLRRYYTSADGKLLPTRKGIALSINRLPDLEAAITKAVSRARDLGLLKDGGNR